ncbi:hypothetical protein TNCV_3034091 [Trichonephila clavipes]|nr:hypothetical protein TNCV_3034091 [Trichonephila clavipes]
MENTHRRPSIKRPKKRRFRGTNHVKGRLTDSLIDKLAHYYGNAIRCNSTSVKEMRKTIWAVFRIHSCSTDDEPMRWFCPTNPNRTWCKYNAAINNFTKEIINTNPQLHKAVRDVIKPYYLQTYHPALLKRNVWVDTESQ